MRKLDHLAIPVRDLDRSRDWWVTKLGLTVEFEIAARRSVAVRDEHDFTIFLVESETVSSAVPFALWLQVADVRVAFSELSARGVAFRHGPQKNFWGFGAEAVDPDGYAVRLWDVDSMAAS